MQQVFAFDPAVVNNGRAPESKFLGNLEQFSEFGAPTSITWHRITLESGDAFSIPIATNEFWTSKQRDANSIHEISYRACFKPQLPAFFIQRLTQPGDRVYDPFLGRGTTAIEAALLDRVPLGSDINPLSKALTEPRLNPPTQKQVESRLAAIPLEFPLALPDPALVFFHQDTLREIYALRTYFLDRLHSGELDSIDRWIRMVATNRLTGHSPGFFSVYTLPPNQAVSFDSQKRINRNRKQIPPRRDVVPRILGKSKRLLKDLTDGERRRLIRRAKEAILLSDDATQRSVIEDNSIALVVTSPPFLNIVDYRQDNWLRLWFHGYSADSTLTLQTASLDRWRIQMTRALAEIRRVLQPGGHVAFEVGEVRKGSTILEETVVQCGVHAGLMPVVIVINAQSFTKTANCWGVNNNEKGANTNRVVVFRKTK